MRTFILVADGSRATLFFRSDQQPQLKVMQVWDNVAGRTPDSESESDNLGTTHAGGSHHGSSTPTDSPKRNSKRMFVQMLAETLRERLSGYDELVLIAAPKALGDLRKKLDETVRRRVIVDLNKDLTHLSIHEVQPILEGLLGPRSSK